MVTITNIGIFNDMAKVHESSFGTFLYVFRIFLVLKNREHGILIVDDVLGDTLEILERLFMGGHC